MNQSGVLAASKSFLKHAAAFSSLTSLCAECGHIPRYRHTVESGGRMKYLPLLVYGSAHPCFVVGSLPHTLLHFASHISRFLDRSGASAILQSLVSGINNICARALNSAATRCVFSCKKFGTDKTRQNPANFWCKGITLPLLRQVWQRQDQDETAVKRQVEG
jgi:hypothetical protein